MKPHLMRITVVFTCHIVIPLCLALAGFYVLALITGHLLLALSGTVLAALAAWFAARRYTLIAIGPRFTDRDYPITWPFIARRMLKLFLLLLITPATVLIVYAVSSPFTPFSVIVSVLAGIPAQVLVCLFLDRDAQTWQRRIHRGRVIRSPESIQHTVAAHIETSTEDPSDYVPWAGMMIPRELMAPHTKILGMTGSGKTVTIRLMLQALVNRCSSNRNIKLVVFDPKREIYSYILAMNPQVPVLLLEATDLRGLALDMAADIKDPNHAKAVAKLLVPDEHSTQPYFARSGRRILEWVIRYLISHAQHWNLQDVFMILNDLSVLQRILPAHIVAKYFKPEATLKNTLSTLDTLTSRFETVAACWAHAEKEGRTISLNDFEASPNSAILVIPRRLDIADAIDPTIRLVFERLIHLWLARPDIRFLPPEQRPETYVILDETAKAGNITRLDDLLLMGRAKGVSVYRLASCPRRTRHANPVLLNEFLVDALGILARRDDARHVEPVAMRQVATDQLLNEPGH